MSSRDKILETVTRNQPPGAALPNISFPDYGTDNLADKFRDTLAAIGGSVIVVEGIAQVYSFIKDKLPAGARNVTAVPYLADVLELVDGNIPDPHTMQNVEYAFIEGRFAVAENGAVWVTEDRMGLRVLPFICQHLAVIVNTKDIVATMHGAYDKIADERYGFGTFIAGPSKTADIEQSLVIGAHGARSMTVFLMD